jgi:hypothetical protein
MWVSAYIYRVADHPWGSRQLVSAVVDAFGAPGWDDAWVCRIGEADLCDDDELDLDLEDRWDDADWVRRLMARIDAEVEAEAEENDPDMRWLKENRQHRISCWGATFAQAGVIPPDGWEDWVR